MSDSLSRAARLGHLTNSAKPSPAHAGLLTRRERGSRMVRAGISRSGLLLKEITDKDHGQASREIDGKEKLDFYEMVEKWPAAVWVELLPLIALEVCPGQFRVVRSLTIETITEKSA